MRLCLIYMEGFYASTRGACPFRVGRERGAWMVGYYAGHKGAA